jgi:hypothetical protein
VRVAAVALDADGHLVGKQAHRLTGFFAEGEPWIVLQREVVPSARMKYNRLSNSVANQVHVASSSTASRSTKRSIMRPVDIGFRCRLSVWQMAA